MTDRDEPYYIGITLPNATTASIYTNQREGYETVKEARSVLIGMIRPEQLIPGLTVAIFTRGTRVVVWEKRLNADGTWTTPTKSCECPGAVNGYHTCPDLTI